MTSNINPESQSPSYEFMRRVCDQIEQDVQLLLNNLSIEDATHLNPRMLQKCISSTKQAVIKAISSRISQIIAIEDKFKHLIFEISEELEVQKEKAKEMFCKYEEKILECDRYKMETVHLSQLYEALYRENLQMKRKLYFEPGSNRKQQLQEFSNQKQFTQFLRIQKQVRRQNEHTQTSDKEYKMIEIQDYNKIEQKLLQYKEQRELFHTQLTKNNETMEKLKKNAEISQERIHKLLDEVNYYNNLIEEERETQQQMKQQIAKLVMDLQEAKINLQEANEKSKGDIEKLKEQHRKELSQKQERIVRCGEELEHQKEKQMKYKQKIEELNLKIKELNQRIKQVDENLSQKSGYLDQIKQVIDEKNKQIVNLKAKLHQQKQINQQLNNRINKYDGIAKTQQMLQAKYGKKTQLLSKHNKELEGKIKFYKQQNERLYEAMEQFAGKQVKLTNKLRAAQAKLESQKQEIERIGRMKIKLFDQFAQMKKELGTLRKSLYGEFEVSITKIIRQFGIKMRENREEFSLKLNKKFNSLQEEWSNDRQQLIQKLNISQKQYRILQQKCLQSEINANKIASSLVQSKNQIHAQIAHKEQIIRSLQLQLLKQKQFNENTTNKLADVVKKYEKVHSYSQEEPNGRLKFLEKDEDVYELERQIIQQRNRYANLQYQYQTLIKH